MAVKQLNSLWKRLSRDLKYLSLYTDFLREYEDLGHLERVVESSELPTQYYIPHHAHTAKKACLKGFGNLVVGKGKGLSQRFP
ncbi:hypothetical protein AVEN_214399-1 [Araneus ventricosus]|uniref:Uncharacterized protein n=1 Tax=Araneus ventricosus TaxID=182803 RepID=A0A4Y2MAJ2_ARAVE|nr:hypothetical protein AVEN_214399-1 [Araneus ventricosus]